MKTQSLTCSQTMKASKTSQRFLAPPKIPNDGKKEDHQRKTRRALTLLECMQILSKDSPCISIGSRLETSLQQETSELQ